MNTIIEKIRAEVNRLQHTDIPHTDEWWDGADYVRRRMKEVLSDLEKEEKPIEGLEEELVKYIGYPEENLDGKWKKKEVEEIARHFAQWGAEHRGSSEIPNDLEEVAKKHSCYDEDCEGAWYEPIVRNAFIAGAKWQKEQMMDEWLKDRDGCFWDGVEEGKKAMREQLMKEAVEGRINNFPYPTIIELNKRIPTKEWYGQKVKIIIVKED